MCGKDGVLEIPGKSVNESEEIVLTCDVRTPPVVWVSNGLRLISPIKRWEKEVKSLSEAQGYGCGGGEGLPLMELSRLKKVGVSVQALDTVNEW